MRLLIIFLLALLSVESAVQNRRRSCKLTSTSTKNTNNAKNPCVHTLERIIYSPIKTGDVYSEDDILEWEKELRQVTPLLFTQNNATFYWSLEQRYNINIDVYDGFGYGWVYGITPTPTVNYISMTPMSANYIRSLTNYGAYSYHPNTRESQYSFTVWNTDGRLIVVTFTMLRETATI